MVKKKTIRRRPSTPNLQYPEAGFTLDFPPGVGAESPPHGFPHTAATDPASPPETPTTSPPLSRKISLKPRHQLPFDFAQALAFDPAIRPVGNGHQFSYRPGVGPDQMSPRSSPASLASSDSLEPEYDESAAVDGVAHQSVASLVPSFETDSSEEEEEADGGDELAAAPRHASERVTDSDEDADEDDDEKPEELLPRLRTSRIRITSKTTKKEHASAPAYNLVIEEVDPMDSENEGLDILFPEEVESLRSRSRSRQKELDKGMMDDLEKLNCNPDALDDVELDNEVTIFLRRRQELKRLRRVSQSSSCGKRTRSEISWESDGEDGSLDVNDLGSSAWRMRKKLHRTSLLFHDPPAPRIDELEEPDSSEDEYSPSQSLAMELPYWTTEMEDVESK